MLSNMILQSLLEAAKKPDSPDEEDKKDQTQDNPDENEEDAANADEKPDGEDEGSSDENKDSTENEDEDGEKDDDEEKPDDQGDDDFSLDGDNSDEENPDGLVDPDDDGSGDTEEPEETNVQTTILNSMSKLDRLLAQRSIYSNFLELRSSISTLKSTLEQYEATINPEVREVAFEKLNNLYSSVERYLLNRFGYMGYEDNLQNYNLFIKVSMILPFMLIQRH